GNARNCFRRSIHAPGLGSMRRQPGYQVSNTNGSAMPAPSAANTSSVNGAGCASANPNAAPMNGAVHGDAMTTARMPESTALTYWLRADQPAADEGTNAANSKTPDRFNARMKNSSARPV